MGQKEWSLAHSLWRLVVVCGSYKLEEMLLYVNQLSLYSSSNVLTTPRMRQLLLVCFYDQLSRLI
jgi:hypothetical protein